MPIVGPALGKSPTKNIVVEDPYIETSQDEVEIPMTDLPEVIHSTPTCQKYYQYLQDKLLHL